MHPDPVLFEIGLKLHQVVVQVGDDVAFDLGRGLPQFLPLRDGFGGDVAFGPDVPECSVVPIHPLLIFDKGFGQGGVIFCFRLAHIDALSISEI